MKTVTIDELLTWAFVHELPKGGGVEGLANPNSAWGMIVELGTRVSTGRQGMPGQSENYFIEQGEPHDDALAVGEAVARLACCDVMFSPDWRPLADWPSDDPTFERLTRDAEARAQAAFLARQPERRSAHLVNLVVGQAILGGMPDTGAEPRRVKLVERRGKPAWFIMKSVDDPTTGQPHRMEVDGYDGKKGRPLRGAYRRHEFSDDPLGDILGRMDYQIWVAAMRFLQRDIGAALIGHRLGHSGLSMTPWLARDGEGLALVKRAEHRTMKKTAAVC